MNAAEWVDVRRWYCWVSLVLLGAWVRGWVPLPARLPRRHGFCTLDRKQRHTQFAPHSVDTIFFRVKHLKPFLASTTHHRHHRRHAAAQHCHPSGHPPLPAAPLSPPQDGYENAKDKASNLGDDIKVGG